MEFQEFDVLKNKGKKAGKRDRSESSFFQEIIGGLQDQEQEQMK